MKAIYKGKQYNVDAFIGKRVVIYNDDEMHAIRVGSADYLEIEFIPEDKDTDLPVGSK